MLLRLCHELFLLVRRRCSDDVDELWRKKVMTPRTPIPMKMTRHLRRHGAAESILLFSSLALREERADNVLRVELRESIIDTY